MSWSAAMHVINCYSKTNKGIICQFVCIYRYNLCGQQIGNSPDRADQNTSGALLEFPMRTAMHGKSLVSSAISVCDNQKNFKISFSIVAVAQWR